MEGKRLKALTFSYDDGVTQDIRLIELFNKYGMKATFNLNSSLQGRPNTLIREGQTINHNRIPLADIKAVYEGHEIAAHTMHHPFLPEKSEKEIIKEVEKDRITLSEICGYEVEGFAYPGGGKNYDERVSRIIRENTGVKYCRTTVSNHSFLKQEDLYEFKPTVYHHSEWDKMFSLGEEFLNMKASEPAMFYVWGHSYEFDIHSTWEKFEEFLKMMSGRDDVAYITNKEALLTKWYE